MGGDGKEDVCCGMYLEGRNLVLSACKLERGAVHFIAAGDEFFVALL